MEHPINSTHPLEKMNQLAQTHLDLKQWGFLEAARFDKKLPVIIFRSEWCLVRFTWAGQEASGENIINIHYGRLHASFENSYLMWNGEKCHCWHDIIYVLHFLDGYSPDEVAGRNYRRPAIMEQYRQSEVGQRLRGRIHQPEWLTSMHAAIWKRYGIRLFEVFDLRRPDIWERYHQFMEGLYDLEGRSPNIDPPLDNIC